MIEQLITYTGYFILFVNAFLYCKMAVISRSLTLFTVYLCVIAIIQGLSFLLWYHKMNNLYLSHFYFIAQFILLSLFYREALVRKAYKTLTTALLAAVLMVLGVQYALQPGLYYKFNILEIVLTSLPLVAYSVLYFYESLNENKQLLYINSGIFFYLLSSTLLFASGNFINDSSSSLSTLIWKMNVSLYLIYQILLFTEWYKNLRTKKQGL